MTSSVSIRGTEEPAPVMFNYRSAPDPPVGRGKGGLSTPQPCDAGTPGAQGWAPW